jgi:hypothetical protein
MTPDEYQKLYAVRVELKNRKLKLQLTDRQLGLALGISPPNLTKKLNGFSPMSETEEKALDAFLRKCELSIGLPKFSGRPTM